MNNHATIVLIRHAPADSAGLLAGRLPGWGLNSAGRLAATKLAATIRTMGIRALYSSPRDRALQTAAALGSALGLTPRIDEAFDELDYGEWSGKRISDMDRLGGTRWRAFNQRRGITRPPLGEWMIEAQIRALLRLRSLVEVHSSATIAIVSHADIIKAIVAYYSGFGLDGILRIRISPASITTLLCHERGGEIVALNLTRVEAGADGDVLATL